MKTRKLGRKQIICKVCNEICLNFGKGMCNSCIRHYKRQTKPSFYLGTQYSEIKRRCTHKNTKGRYYHGKEFCSKEEFINKFLNNPTFLNQYKKWQESEYKRGDSPSVDRINNSLGYNIENLQILAQRDNSPKDWSNQVILYENNTTIVFKSQLALSQYINIDTSLISNILNDKVKNNTGYKFERYYDNT